MRKYFLVISLLIYTVSSLEIVYSRSEEEPAIPYTTLIDTEMTQTGFELEDMNNDGYDDVVAIMFNGLYDFNIYIYHNKGDQTFEQSYHIAISEELATEITISDMNNDGYLDIVTAQYTKGIISWFKNNSDGTFSDEMIIGSGVSRASAVHCNDIDNDGYVDVLTTGLDIDTLNLYMNNQDETFQSPIYLSDEVYDGRFITTIDIDNDNDLDIFLLEREEVVWFENYNDGTFSTEINIDYIMRPDSMKFVDFDEDNDMDFFLLETDGSESIRYYENNGDNTFQNDVIITDYTDSPLDFKLVDIDNDNDLDLLVPSFWDSKLYQYVNDEGTLLKDENKTINIPSIQHLQVKDFDGDGDIDVLASKRSSGDIVVVYNDYISSKIVTYYYYITDTSETYTETGVFLGGDTITFPETALDGYEIHGWYEGLEFSTKIEEDFVITDSITVYAKLRLTYFYISCDYPNGGSSTRVLYKDTLTDIADYCDSSKVDNFTGWDIELPMTMPAHDITITAQYNTIDNPVDTPNMPLFSMVRGISGILVIGGVFVGTGTVIIVILRRKR